MFEIIKNMTWKEKIDYIWTYYKIHIISVVIVIAIIANLLNIYIFNPAPKEYVTVTFMGDYTPQDQLDLLDQALNEHILPADPGNVTCTSYSFYDSEDPSLTMAMQQKFMAMTSVGDIDVIVATKEEFAAMKEQGYFAPLDTIFTTAELGQLSNDLILGEDNKPIGIPIQASDIFTKIGYAFEGKYIGVCVNSQRTTAAKDAIDFMLGK